jgi:DNA-binding MarR family transcriptional regulator
MSPAGSRDYTAPRHLQQLPSWLLAALARTGDRLVTSALSRHGVRKPHYAVLHSLAEEGAASQAELGRRLWIDRSDLHALLNELEDAGHLARVRDPDDRRRNLVELTPAGSAALARLDADVDAAQVALLEPLPDRDQARLQRLLTRLVDHHQRPAA